MNIQGLTPRQGLPFTADQIKYILKHVGQEVATLEFKDNDAFSHTTAAGFESFAHLKHDEYKDFPANGGGNDKTFYPGLLMDGEPVIKVDWSTPFSSEGGVYYITTPEGTYEASDYMRGGFKRLLKDALKALRGAGKVLVSK